MMLRQVLPGCMALIISSMPMSSLATGQKSKVPEAVPGEYVIKLKPQQNILSYLRTNAIGLLSARLGLEIKSAIPNENVLVIRRPKIETTESAIEALKNNPYIELAEPNYIYRVLRVANDPMFGNLWGLNNIGQSDSENSAGVVGVDIGAERAWDLETGSARVIIAVIDTGIDYNHPDLRENIWTNFAELNGQTGVDDDGNGFIDDIHGFSFADDTGKKTDPLDDHGHGSHCSGTIGAKGNDGSGIVGINWNVRLMAVKFLGADGGGTLEGAIKAIDYATKMGAKILSNSWGGGAYSEILKLAIERSQAAGALFVVAAGNDSANNDQEPHYPSSYNLPNMISVAAIDNKGELATFSNYGKRSVDLAAPGVNIYSSLTNGRYDSWSGTSMATPHVSGIAGLLLAHEPELSALQIKERIVSTAKPLIGLRNKVATGGLASAYNALTNTHAPADPNDPSLWQSKKVAISSAHPYKPKTRQEFAVNVPGAKEISIYFSRFDTEKKYDTVTIFDRKDNPVAVLSGGNDDTYSPIILGDFAKIVFESDDSLERQGFDITKVSYR